ncbi:hypothetical protein DYB26_014637, partial [Aphanomyces astaci]
AITYAKDNQKALGIIIESINVNQYQHVDGLTDALAAYLALKAHHEPQTHVDKIGLLAEYHAIRWEPKRETLPVFIDRFYNLVRKLRDAGCAEDEYMTVAKLLAIMPWCLRIVLHQINLMDERLQTLTVARSLLEAEYKAAVANGALQAPGNEADVTRALGALDSGRDRGGRGRGRGPPKAGRGASRSQKREGTCHHCGKVGHWKAECHARQRGDPPTAMPSRAPGNESVGAAPNHTVYLFAGMEAPGLSLSAAKATEKIIIDSGASSHTTGAKDHLYDVAACDRTIIVANGEVANATTMGKLDIDMQNGAKMTLTEVLIIDGMPMTLVSVPALCRRNAACTVSFGQGKCSIAVGSTAIATGTLEMPANVYVLNGTMSMPTSATSATSTTSPISNSDKSTLWHERVGHVPLSTLKHCSTLQLGLPTDLAGTLNTPCPACVVSKMHKATAPKSSTRTYKTGDDCENEGEQFDRTPKKVEAPMPITKEGNEARLRTKLRKIALRLQKAPLPDDIKKELWETQLHLHKDIFHLQSSVQDIDAGERPSIPSGRTPSAPPPLTPAPAPAATRPTRDRRAPVRFDDEDFDHRTRDQASTMTYEGV